MERKTTVVNINYEEYDVYIGRGSLFGNPFYLKHDTEKERINCIEKYKKYYHVKKLYNHIHILVGKRLGCYCKPKLCHGDFLVQEVENYLKGQ